MTSPIVDAAMRSYYDRRAPEYDDWWLGTGLFADRDRPGWDAEVAVLISLLGALAPVRTLDVACGTAFLTRHLRGEITALDQSSRMTRIAAERLPDATIIHADAVPLPFGDRTFDRVLTSHFYGHLLPGERATFLTEARRVGHELVVIDSALRPGEPAEQWQERTLDDGSRHRVYKRYFGGEGLAAEIGGGSVLHEGDWFAAVTAPRRRRGASRRPRIRGAS